MPFAYLLPLSPSPVEAGHYAVRRALVDLDILLCRRVPRKILAHPCLLDASPEGPVAKRRQRPSNCGEERLRCVLDESKPGPPARLGVNIADRVVQATRSPHDGNRSVPQAVHLIQATWLEP